MAISTPDPRRRIKLPRNLPNGRRLQPYSRVDAPYFRSPGFYVRVGGLAAVVAVALSLLVLRAWSLEVLQGRHYASLATHQAFRTVDVQSPRGAIVDARGRVLVDTTAQPVVAADPNAFGTTGAHGAWSPSAAGLAALRRFARFTGADTATLVKRIERSVLHSPFAPAVILPRPRPALTIYLQERAPQFPGVKVIYDPLRRYPQGALGSEFLGLLGEVSQQELASSEYRQARPGEIVGQSGIERTYDDVLNPGFGRAHVAVDSLGRIAGPIELPQNKQLPTLQLAIDARLQRAAEKAVLDGIAAARQLGHDATGGSAVVMNPYTGAIYALASVPTFDQVRAAKDPNYVERLYHDPTSPTLNRAIAGVYPTGSTFKLVTAEAALSAGLITPATPLLCSGSFDLGGFVFHNVEAGVYTTMTLPTAIAQSCDTWFYRVGDIIYQHDPARQGMLLQDWARKLGLGARTGIDVTGDSPGLVPTPRWFLKANRFPWTEGQTINLAIGQGALQASPLQMAVMTSAIVNGGTVVRPHVGQAVIRNGVAEQLRFPPVRHVRLVDAPVIREGMYLAAHDPSGTSAAIFSTFPVPVAGKTGTAEAPPGSDHSWYESFAPYGHPKVVVVVMIEHGGFGAEAAAPAAKEIYQAFFHVKAATTPGG